MPLSWDDDEHTHVSHSPLEKQQRSARDRPYLVVLSGTDVGQMHKVDDGECLIGRSTAASVRLNDDGVSRRHARIAVADGVVTVEDLGSANGVFVNGARVQSSPLRDGDKIQLGGTTILKFTYHDSLEEEFQRKMYDAALRDPLTKAFNKKHLLDRLTAELAYATRHGTPLALLMVDVDFFKNVNDTHGHVAGDAVLVHVADLVRSSIRAEDLFARYGGEELAILARATTTDEGCVLAERLRSRIETSPCVFGGVSIAVTVSVGVAALPDVAAGATNDLISAADSALYAAKRNGRNRVMAHGRR